MACKGKQSAGWFVGEYAAERRRKSERATDVAAHSKSCTAARHDRCFAARAAARGVLHIVRVVRTAVDEVVGLIPHAPFGNIRTGDGNRTGRAQSLNDRRIAVRAPMFASRAAK